MAIRAFMLDGPAAKAHFRRVYDARVERKNFRLLRTTTAG
jgi:hypothetical protein